MENILLLNYFDKFNKYPQFKEIKSELDEKSKFRYFYDINIGDITVPYVGPDETLGQVIDKIAELWNPEIAEEMKYLLKYYEGGQIESLQELIIVLQIKYHENKDERYNNLIKAVLENRNIEESEYKFLMYETDLMSSSLLFHFLNL